MKFLRQALQAKIGNKITAGSKSDVENIAKAKLLHPAVSDANCNVYEDATKNMLQKFFLILKSLIFFIYSKNFTYVVLRIVINIYEKLHRRY